MTFLIEVALQGSLVGQQIVGKVKGLKACVPFNACREVKGLCNFVMPYYISMAAFPLV